MDLGARCPDLPTPVLAFFKGAYGPTLRIDVQCIADLEGIRQLLQKLAEREVTMLEFCHVIPSQYVGLASFQLGLMPAQTSEQEVEIIVDNHQSISIHWKATPERWGDCVAQLEGLIRASSPGHQYFSEGGTTTALIVIAFFEPRANSLVSQ